MKDYINRRDFFKRGSIAIGLPFIMTCGKTAITRGHGEVILAKKSGATSGLGRVNMPVVQELVDNGIRQFTGLDNVGRAWKAIFPDLQRTTVIGLKINCVAGNTPGQLCTQKETVTAIINGLEQMPVAGGHFPRSNVVVWDRWDDEISGAGYALNSESPKERIVGISRSMEDTDPSYGYDSQAAWDSLGDRAYFTTILSRICDYQINVPVLKSIGRGVTFAMKNMFGNFSTAHPHWAEIGTIYHKEFHTRICDVSAAELVRSRFVLHVGDALLGMKNRGPAGPPDFEYGAVLFSRDPVALDAVGVKIINEQDVELEQATFMLLAQNKGLGIADPDRIEIETI
jgi:uncharacterized protein (DUF362 family)